LTEEGEMTSWFHYIETLHYTVSSSLVILFRTQPIAEPNKLNTAA